MRGRVRRATKAMANKFETLGDLANDGLSHALHFIEAGTTRDVRQMDGVLERTRKLRAAGQYAPYSDRVNAGRHELHEALLQLKMAMRAAEEKPLEVRKAKVQPRADRVGELRAHWYEVAQETAKEAAAILASERKGDQPLQQRPPLGTVVRYVGRRRRYVVTRHDPVGSAFGLVALSGAFRGSGPSGVAPRQVVKDADQRLAFSGKLAKKLEARAAWELGAKKAAELGARAPASHPVPEKGSEAEAVRDLLEKGHALGAAARRLLVVVQRMAEGKQTPEDVAELERVQSLLKRVQPPGASAQRMFRQESATWAGNRSILVQIRGLGQPSVGVDYVRKVISDNEKQQKRLYELAHKHGPHALPFAGMPPPGAIPVTGKVSAAQPTKHALDQAARIVHSAYHAYLKSPRDRAARNDLNRALAQAKSLGLSAGETKRLVLLVKEEHAKENRAAEAKISARLKAAKAAGYRSKKAESSARYRRGQKKRAAALEEKKRRQGYRARMLAVRAKEAAEKKRAAAAAKIDRAALRAQVRHLKAALRLWTKAAEQLLKAREQATLGHNHAEQQKRLEQASAIVTKGRDALEVCLNRGMTQTSLFK